eukprot:CAMPEP_0117434774 /NCGR_PEP_ID=MMETSP0759-20121206/125_1 /TAXON_ID=63605 /ORGANISM="Percolomonas cosmopolitus, Strain WS" /LENGTH=276 /DNA_ID=CAMNT_0005226273 /DNA_START=95 /DNA_END=921 /DNA_ORIENTATION=+
MTISQLATSTVFDCIIVGGSFAGVSAALAMARAMRPTLLLDTQKPCNWMVDHAHNFLGYDHSKPSDILDNAKEQLLERYNTTKVVHEKAIELGGSNGQFTVRTESGSEYQGKKVILATGVREVLPDIPGFEQAWGRSILHCPYCHGYEEAKKKAAYLGNGNTASMFAKMVSHWNPDLTVLTNGKSEIEDESVLKENGIKVIQTKVKSLDVDKNGRVQKVNFVDGTSERFEILYAHNEIEQSVDLAQQIGCNMKGGHVEASPSQKTSVPGVYVAGDA